MAKFAMAAMWNARCNAGSSLDFESRCAPDVLRGFPDGEHDVAIILSQSDAAKLRCYMCFEAAALGDQAALRSMFTLLIEGARSGPGELDDPSASFPGEQALRAHLRRQLTAEFAIDPLAVAADEAHYAGTFSQASFDLAASALFPDGGQGSDYGETRAELQARLVEQHLCENEDLSEIYHPESASV